VYLLCTKPLLIVPRVLIRSRNPENPSNFTHLSQVSKCFTRVVLSSTEQRNEELLRQPSSAEGIANAEPNRSSKIFTPPTPTVVATYPSAQPQTELAPGEKLVSYVYCRICRRDPCRQPAATMCGHVFCYQCVLEYLHSIVFIDNGD
jgi:hypothetical protein